MAWRFRCHDRNVAAIACRLTHRQRRRGALDRRDDSWAAGSVFSVLQLLHRSVVCADASPGPAAGGVDCPVDVLLSAASVLDDAWHLVVQLSPAGDVLRDIPHALKQSRDRYRDRAAP